MYFQKIICQIQIEYVQSILDILSVLYYWLSILSVHKEKNSLKRSKYISQSALLLLYIYQVLQELLSISKTQPKINTERERVALWCRLTYFWGFVFGNKRQILDNKLWSAFPFTIFHCWITNPFGVGDKRHFSQSFPYLHHL